MILDGHIHTNPGKVDRQAFLGRLKAAGINGGAVISISPDSLGISGKKLKAAERLDNLIAWTGPHPSLYPFFWIDPLEEDALKQVKAAVMRKVAGFKVICNRFYPGDRKAMAVYSAIAKAGKPILFHSGILWDGRNSAKYNRPGEFEALLDIDGLKFALAHISWPWCDEHIAVYGKFLNAYTRRPGLSVEMFIDITPGTPGIYRREALTKLFTVGYDVENNVIFGTDSETNDYNYRWAREWVRRDRLIFKDIGLGRGVLNKIYSENLLRFVGASGKKVQKRYLRPAE